MGLRVTDVREFVVRPSQQRLGLWSQTSENLVVGTGLTESGGFTYLDQMTPGPGPAYGLWQMEKATHDDLWINYLPGQPSALRDVLLEIAGSRNPRMIPPITTLHWNLMYAAAMCRIHYKRVRASLPVADDFADMAAYWKQWYNTPLGKGTIEKALPYFKQAVQL